jgi:hypothetical protein
MPDEIQREEEAIVRELAERGPLEEDDGNECAFCSYDSRHDRDHPGGQENPMNHKPGCIWRRAKVLYPGDDANA